MATSDGRSGREAVKFLSIDLLTDKRGLKGPGGVMLTYDKVVADSDNNVWSFIIRVERSVLRHVL